MFLLTKVIKSECCKTAQLKAKVYKRFFLVFQQSKEKRGEEFPISIKIFLFSANESQEYNWKVTPSLKEVTLLFYRQW